MPDRSTNQNRTLAEVWTRNRHLVLERLQAIENYLTALASSSTTPELRTDAMNNAHKLAGSLGMFGLQEGTDLARSIENALDSSAPITAGDLPALSETFARLRRLIEEFQVGTESAS